MPTLRHRAFTLLEVVVAIGIFAIGMVGALALFTPLARSTTTSTEAAAAARVAEAVLARLRTLPFDEAAALLQTSAAVRAQDATGSFNPNDGANNPFILFGKRDGEVGLYVATATPRGWYGASVPTPNLIADADKFFEIELIRHDTLSPQSADATASMLAFTMRVRWPAFLPPSGGAAIQVGANPAGGAVTFDHSSKHVFVCAGTLSR